MKYNHAFALAFTIESNHPDGNDIFGVHFTNAVLKRIIDLNENAEWDEAVGAPFDTFEIEEEEHHGN